MLGSCSGIALQEHPGFLVEAKIKQMCPVRNIQNFFLAAWLQESQAAIDVIDGAPPPSAGNRKLA